MDVLAASGESGMRIEDIAKRLGVSKGSFYHHFRDRNEFERAIIKYWDHVYTRDVGARVADGDTEPRDRLWQLMLAITDKDTPRYDIPIFAWAVRNPELAKLIRKTHRYRATFVRTLFAEIGFSGLELEARTRSFVTTMTHESSIFHEPDRAKLRRLLKKQLEMFVRT